MKKELKFFKFSIYCVGVLLSISTLIALNIKDYSIIFETLFLSIPGLLFSICLDILSCDRKGVK